MIEIIKHNPGIQPSGLNRRLDRTEWDALRAALSRRRSLRKVKEGQATSLQAT